MPTIRGLVVSLSILVAVPVRAEPLDQAEDALRELRYEEADELLEHRLRAGDNGPRALARIYRLRGQLAGSLGDEAGAEAAFARWLVLEPGASLPDGTSPKITGPFQAAAAGLAGASLRVDFHLAGDESAVTLQVVEDPLALVSAARAAYRGRVDEVRAADGRARVELAGPRRGRLLVTVAALDVYGNRLSEHELAVEHAEPPPAPKPVAAVEKPPAPRILPPPERAEAGFELHRGWVLGGVAVGLGALGAYHGWQVVRGQRELDRFNASSDEHTYLEASATADRLRRDSIIANSSFVLAGACALTALLLWPESPPERRLSWQLGRDQARVAMEWSW
jgi:hypothetical protein